ncbi:MAG: DUF177 domain-containing protein [Alphaproteobacteria bacterium]|nr:DUF177 domain-containing protein [Alphaproteobacteria bacterium]
MKPEWSHEIEAESITAKALNFSLEPDAQEKKALSNRLDLHEIENLSCEFSIRRNEGSMVVHIQGKLIGSITQKCIVTLEPVISDIHEEFEAWYADPDQAVSFARAKRERMTHKDLEDQPILEEHEDPEPIIDGKIDVGEVATQFLSLALNPFPRAENSEFKSENECIGDEPDGMYNNPFAALKNWKERER